MEHLIDDLAKHNYQSRKYAVVECGSWAPQAGGMMKELLSACKNTECIGEKITLLSSVKEEQAQALRDLGKAIAEDILR